MNNKILYRLQKLDLRTVESNSKNLQQYISALPIDYIEFMALYDGGVGFIGENKNYLDLWSLENISKLNPYYKEEDFSNQVIIVGSDGSGTLYGYDLLSKCFFETDEYQMNREEIVRCGNTFLELLKYLVNESY